MKKCTSCGHVTYEANDYHPPGLDGWAQSKDGTHRKNMRTSGAAQADMTNVRVAQTGRGV